MISIKQGESFKMRFTNKKITALDDFTAVWGIYQAAGKPALRTGTLSLNPTPLSFELSITHNVTYYLPVGKYFLVVQITNTVLGFEQEYSDTLKIQRKFMD